MARIPAKNVSTSDREVLRNLERNLKLVIFGQDPAIEALAAAIKMARSGLGDERKPVGSFLFAGPTGVGKTEVTRQLAIALGVEFLRFDMSEYMERHTVSRLIGAPPGYVGFDQGGLLTEAIAKHPHCVLLLDEIEKAHPDVFNLLLQVMDHGTLTDNNGRKADFRHVIIVMTTNAGAAGDEPRAASASRSRTTRSDGMEAIRRLFSPEFRNRLDAIIQFAPLDRGRPSSAWSTSCWSRSRRSSSRRACTLSIDDAGARAGSPSTATTRRWVRGRWRGCIQEHDQAPAGRGTAVRQARRWRARPASRWPTDGDSLAARHPTGKAPRAARPGMISARAIRDAPLFKRNEETGCVPFYRPR